MDDDFRHDVWVLTDESFGEMAWHDTRIHAVALGDGADELIFDLDYIVRWLEPAEGENHYRIWFAPATLVFAAVTDVQFDIGAWVPHIDIDAVRREKLTLPEDVVSLDTGSCWEWTIDCQEGDITFKSSGFHLYFRAEPADLDLQDDIRARIGFSFERGRPAGEVLE
jgi:hypothetical protein